MKKSNQNETIAAVSTPIGEGGIGIVRLTGPRALDIVGDVFIPKEGKLPRNFRSHTVHYGHIIDNETGKAKRIVDEVLVTVMRGPRTYTREDIVEINCHGGIQSVKNILDLVIRRGARLAEPGEFTKRAFLNGRIDLAQAEAVLDVIRAKTAGSLKVAVSQLEGELSEKINVIRDTIIDMASNIEAAIDFPEEELDIIDKKGLSVKAEGAVGLLESMIKTYDEGALLREGILAMICGKPNAGKSSLMNLLLKRDRVIVSAVPGTTRDAVEEMINIKGIPIRLVDTAGIAETGDALEREGVGRSKRYMELADIVLFMIDASSGFDNDDKKILKMIGNKKKIAIINKIDMPSVVDTEKLKKELGDSVLVEISVTKKKNIDILENSIADLVWRGGFDQGEGAVVSNIRHKELLDKARANMLSVSKLIREDMPPEVISIDLKEAAYNLGLITGRSVSEDILDRIFQQFCIGK